MRHRHCPCSPAGKHAARKRRRCVVIAASNKIRASRPQLLSSNHNMLRASALLTVLSTGVATAAYAFDPLNHLAGISPYFE
jgi:hypothetical protein